MKAATTTPPPTTTSSTTTTTKSFYCLAQFLKQKRVKNESNNNINNDSNKEFTFSEVLKSRVSSELSMSST
jgi:hypothetical protein